MEKILSKFTIQPHYAYVPLLGNSVETGTRLWGITKPFNIKVPKSIYSALTENGYIDDIYFGMNSFKAEWVKDRWWLYETHFDADKNYNSCKLTFEGVDYSCLVFLNGKLLGEHVGASYPFSYQIFDLLKEKDNVLRVLVKSAPDEMGQIGYTDKVYTQRPRFDYKWDFSARLVNIGIYRPVKLLFYNDVSINYVVFSTENYKKRECKAKICFDVLKQGSYTCKIRLFDDLGFEYCKTYDLLLSSGECKVNKRFILSNTKLWYPNGIGKADLYHLEITLMNPNGVVCDQSVKTVGIRQITLEQNMGAQDALPYTFCVNGIKFFTRGFNLTPLDQLLGSATYEKYYKILSLAKEGGANIVRVWGGGIIEQDIFYEICSKLGLMIWQDMIQSSSGLSNVPSTESNFLFLLKKTTKYVCTQKGSFPSLALISGGNELFGEDGCPITLEHKNIKAITSIINRYLPNVAFLPSTSSGPTQEADMKNFRRNHDIHGPWLYNGNDNYFKHYNNLKCLFAGEFGANGMTSIDSMKKFLSLKDIGVFTMENNDVWRHHGEWWDSAWAIGELFGKVDELESYTAISRFLQAYAINYAINSHRRQYPYNSGCMVWQLNELYPNISSTALVDYYGQIKPAYYAAKRAYAPVSLSFRFDKMLWAKNEINKVEIFLTSDLESQPYEVTVSQIINQKENKSVYKAIVGKSATIKVAELNMVMPENGIVIINVSEKEHNTYNRAIFFIRNENNIADKKYIQEIYKYNEL